MSEHWLIVAHEATNSGAPRVLLEVLRGARAAREPGWTCEFCFRYGGILLPEFAGLGPTHVLAHRWSSGSSWSAGIFRKFLDRPLLQPRKFQRWFKVAQGRRFDVVFNNTGTNSYLVPAARQLGRPVITHVHELGAALHRFNSASALAQTLENTDHFIAVSPAVKTDLQELGVAAERVSVAPNFIATLPPVIDEITRSRRLVELGFSPDTAVIVGCGHLDPIKGVDLFIDLAASVIRSHQTDLVFVWIGGEQNARYATAMKRFARRRGLDRHLRWVGALADPAPWFEAARGVVITSRLESFSLVALEAGSRARPVAGFAGARGLELLLGHSSDALVPGHEVEAMARVVVGWLGNPAEANRQGQELRTKIGEQFLARQRVADILSIVESCRQTHG